ncbi:MAG: AAA family ATPase [Chitinophagaceae bacterium]|nr:AAA family ATPase [Chitinophagaceae bacterium]
MKNLAAIVTKEQVLAALEYFLNNDVELTPSAKFDLVYKGKTFPPKEVVRKAAEMGGIKNWQSYRLVGGDPANIPLQDLGFEIVPKGTVAASGTNTPVNINYILVNITWNSKDWKQPSDDKSGHAWVSRGNIPHESWNFDFDNKRNTKEKIYGYAQFTSPPKVTGNNNLLIFYSDKKIVGFYGRAEILPEAIEINKKESYNLVGEKALSLVLKNKITDVKEKGYLEELMRVGQIGFSYLQKQKTILSILKEALKLNTGDAYKLNSLIAWVNGSSKLIITNETIYMSHLNTILYGPPGTGKTYKTIERALKIANPDFGFTGKTRKELKAEYERLMKDGQIEFITFHQSLSYEDFIEGIKPVEPGPEDEFLKYEIKDGLFKRLAERASKVPDTVPTGFSISDDEFQKASFYKISLGDTSNPDDDQIYKWCIDNGYIALGWGQANDFTGLNESQIQQMSPDKITKYAAQAVNYFIHYLKTGDYVVVTYGNLQFRAIGKITGGYEFKNVEGLRTHQFRKVQWLLNDVELPYEELYNKQFQQQTIYRLHKREIKKEFFVKAARDTTAPKPKNYILIIDEINRGNVSQIFGELITLIEDDKRAGAAEALTITLPYSKKAFTVPSNLYIIGTMNTADRSVEALDTALRRRFAFEHIQPEPGLLNKTSDGIDLVQLLTTINNRIEYLLTKDHAIGHAWLMNVFSLQDLKAAFKNKILPLLQEYFYNDYAKIGLVLGKNFVEAKKDNHKFAKFDDELAAEYGDKTIYVLKEVSGLGSEDFKSIYEKNT